LARVCSRATPVEVEYDEPRSIEEDIDADYINDVWPEIEVRELEGVDEDHLVELMDNLTMFDEQ
jgi:hypothetical protein